MLRILKVVLLTLFLAILGHRLYYLYYGVSNVITTLSVFIALFLFIDLILKVFLRNKWSASNWRITFWTLLIAVIGLEFGIKYYLDRHNQISERSFFGEYFSPYRHIRMENKIRNSGGEKFDVGLRLYTPDSERQEITSEFNYTHHYNTFGIRSPDSISSNQKNYYSILNLGDSFTEGVGVPQDSTWSELLKQQLKKQGHNVEVFNAGYRGSDLFYEYYKLDKVLFEKIKPSLVTISINETEINDIIVRGGMERFKSIHKIAYNNPPWWESIYAFSFITRYVIHDILHKKWHFQTQEQFELKKTETLNKICDCLHNNYYQHAKDHGYELLVIYIPMQHEVELGWNTFENCRNTLTASGIHVLDLKESMPISLENLIYLYWQQDRHFNSNGHAMIGEIIGNTIPRIFFTE